MSQMRRLIIAVRRRAPIGAECPSEVPVRPWCLHPSVFPVRELIPHRGMRILPRSRGGAQAAARRFGLKDEARGKVLARLRKVAGQVAGIQRMVEEDRYCVDVLHQVAAVEGALDRVGHLVLASHVETCVASALESGKPRERKEKLDELMDVFSRFGRVRP